MPWLCIRKLFDLLNTRQGPRYLLRGHVLGQITKGAGGELGLELARDYHIRSILRFQRQIRGDSEQDIGRRGSNARKGAGGREGGGEGRGLERTGLGARGGLERM
eukprot:303372-Rhodomonas_salina.1